MDRVHVERDASLLNEVRDMVGGAQTTEFITRAIRHELRLGHLSRFSTNWRPTSARSRTTFRSPALPIAPRQPLAPPTRATA